MNDKKSTGREGLIGPIAVAGLLAIAAVFAVFAVNDNIPTPRVVHTLKPAAVSTPTATPAPTPTPYSGPVAITVAATATMKFTPVLQPADFVNVFQIVDPAHGYYATGETTFLVTHSYAKGYGAPGNAWEKLTVGEVVAYGGHFYRIDYTATPAKGQLYDEPVWGNDPDELVLITCSSRGPGNPATNNFVIRAEQL